MSPRRTINFPKLFTYFTLLLLGGLLLVPVVSYATLTLDSTSLTSDGALTLKSASSSAINFGHPDQSGTITIASTTQALTLDIGKSTSALAISIGSGTGGHTVNIATGTSSAKTINIGTGAGIANTINIGSASSSIAVSSTNWTISTAGTSTIATIRSTVTSLPASPTDGQEVYYVADATNGIVWHLRYNAGSASVYKWEYLGGSALTASISTSEATASASFTDLATVGPSVTVPLAGEYMIRTWVRHSQTTANQDSYHAPKLGTAATSNADQASVYTVSQQSDMSVGTEKIAAVLAASDIVKIQYRVGSANSVNFLNRRLIVWPIRVN